MKGFQRNRKCIGDVERIHNIATGQTKGLELSELKWKGVTTAGVSIPPKSYRSIDALHINNQTPNIADLGLNPFIVDWEDTTKITKSTGLGITI